VVADDGIANCCCKAGLQGGSEELEFRQHGQCIKE
jgi:hypothetical protein